MISLSNLYCNEGRQFIFIIIFIISWILYRKYQQTKLQKCNIPTTSSNWITGSVIDVFKNHIKFHQECKQKFGRIYGYYFGTRPQIATTDLELMSIIEIREFDKFHSRAWSQVKGDCWGNLETSLIHESVSLDRWRGMRGVLSKSFSSARMRESVELINDALDTTLKVLERKQDDQDVDMYKVAEGLTMDVIGRSSCAILVSAQDNPDHSILTRIRPIAEQLLGLEYLPFGLALLFPEFEFIFFWLRKVEYIILRAIDASNIAWLYNFIRKVINKRINDVSGSRKDLLQSMIDSIDENGDQESKFTMDETVANAAIFLIAGYETTATLLGCLSHVLVVYPEVQEKLRLEIEEMVENDGCMGYNVLQLPYLDAVVNECLRVFPPVTNFVNRKAEQDFKYKDIIIPKGTAITFPLYSIHRDEEYWPHPDEFDPERFIGERKKQIKPMAFQPFGAGPRVCIGTRLALLEAKMAVGKILMKYRLTPSARSKINLDDLDIIYKQSTISPRNVYVKLIPL